MIVLERLSRTLNRWVEYFLCGLGLGMTLVVAAQVFYRYALNSSLFWSEELARYILIWMTFLGASVAYFRRAHPAVDVLHVRLPPAARRITTIAVHMLSCLLFGIMIRYGWSFASFVHRQISPALALPKWIVYGIMPLSGVILLLHGITFLLNACKGEGIDG